MKTTCMLIFVALLSAAFVAGCVERLICVTSDPPGAIVWLNDEEVGPTPAIVPFTWYGHYDVVLRKDHYQTIKTVRQAQAPIYQWPGLDLVAECLLPFTFVDQHDWHFVLAEQIPIDPNQLIQRATSFQQQALESP